MCEVESVDRKKVASVRKRMSDAGDLAELADLFNTLGDSTRVRILNALSLAELCVCDISVLVGLSQSAVSHQLRLLRMAHLVRNRKVGKMVYYALDDDHVRSLMEEGLRHVGEDR